MILPAQLRAWLARYPDDADVGLRWSAQSCPLAYCLEEELGLREVRVYSEMLCYVSERDDEGEDEDADGDEEREVPCLPWQTLFLAMVNQVEAETDIITACEARLALEQAERGCMWETRDD